MIMLSGRVLRLAPCVFFGHRTVRSLGFVASDGHVFGSWLLGQRCYYVDSQGFETFGSPAWAALCTPFTLTHAWDMF